LALRAGPKGLCFNVVAAYSGLRCLHGRCGLLVGLLFGGAEDVGALACSLSLGDEQLAQNWSGQGESDCLIKTKHCDGRRRC
jgi:hypothetical protein